jgi:hypothetical protein
MSDSQISNDSGAVPNASMAEASPDQMTGFVHVEDANETQAVAIQPSDDPVAMLTRNSREVLETGRQRQLSRYEITAIVDAARRPTVEKKLRDAFGPDAEVFSIEKLKTAESRADRLAEAEDHVGAAHGIVEELEAEMQEWADSIPENVQGGEKASEVQQAIDDLQTLISDMENLDFRSVCFPGMMG